MARDSRRADMKVTEDVESSLDPAPDGVVKIDAFEITVSDRVSHAIYFRAQKPSDRLMLYHAGLNHGLGEAGGDRTIRFLLVQGDVVLAFWMPNLGPSKPPGGSALTTLLPGRKPKPTRHLCFS
jgi:hypothetical protein